MTKALSRRRTFWQIFGDASTIALLSVALAVCWTLFGVLVAALGGQIRDFVREWLLIQGTFAVLAAFFLCILAKSPALANACHEVAPSAPLSLSRRVRSLRLPVVLGIAILGTTSTTQLGFNVAPPARYFMWLTCLLVCIAAGHITWHFFEVMASALRMPKIEVQVFAYSPGETRCLRRLAAYYATFGAATTLGYLFAFVGTVANDWSGNSTLIRSVQALWPAIYVPCCLLLLIYPHLAIRRVVLDAKERLIVSYQGQINDILEMTPGLSAEDIEKVNALADLIERIDKTPNFAVRLPVILTAGVTSLLNFATLLIPQEALAQVVRERLSWP